MNLNTWRMQFLTSTYFWSCRKVSISTSPQRRIVAQSWVWRVSSKTRSVQGHPEEHLPLPPTPSLVVLWGLGIAIYCEFDSACVALELIDLLTFEKIQEKCIKDAHCKVSYVFLYILWNLRKFKIHCLFETICGLLEYVLKVTMLLRVGVTCEAFIIPYNG